jgi:hypothetical protein
MESRYEDIRDGSGRKIGSSFDTGLVKTTRDSSGRVKATYYHGSNETRSASGKLEGKGDQTLRLLD